MKKSSVFKTISIGIAGLLFFVFQACVHAPPRKAAPCNSNPLVYQYALLNLSQGYKSLSGKLKVRIETLDGRYSFTGMLYAQYPGKLHFDVFGFLNRPRFLLIKEGRKISWKDFDTGQHYSGSLDRCPPFPVKFPFSPLFLRDFMRILFLNFPRPLEVRSTDHASVSCRFLMSCAWGTFNLLIDPAHGLPSEVEGPKGEEKPTRITFSDYSRVSSFVVPHRYGIYVGNVKMELVFKSLAVNPKIPEKYFIPLPGL